MGKQKILLQELHEAINEGDVEAVKRFIAENKERNDFVEIINSSMNQEETFYKAAKSETALEKTIDNNQLEIFRLLLAVPGINLNDDSNKGIPPLMQAIRSRRIEMVRDLLSAGVNVNTRGVRGSNALGLAAAEGNMEIIDALLAVPGINIKAVNDDGLNALMLAAQFNHLPVLKKLLSCQGIDFNATTTQGFNALMLATCSAPQCAKELVSVPGINVFQQARGKMAIDLARERKNNELESLIESKMKAFATAATTEILVANNIPRDVGRLVGGFLQGKDAKSVNRVNRASRKAGLDATNNSINNTPNIRKKP